MEFKGADCEIIRKKVKKKESVTFDIAKVETVFSKSPAPRDWQTYPLSILSKGDLIEIIGILGMDQSLRASFHKLEILATELGGTIYYKDNPPSLISVQVTW